MANAKVKHNLRTLCVQYAVYSTHPAVRFGAKCLRRLMSIVSYCPHPDRAKLLGPPWTPDEKLAALTATLILRPQAT